MPNTKSSYTFPPGFLWGAATSAHQVEGNNRWNDWWHWERSGRVTDVSGDACDHYDRYVDDFDIARSLGHTAHRFSIEWSRIEPERGRFDKAALYHYVEVARVLRARGMEPMATLHHFTLPQWFAEKGSWFSPGAVGDFFRFVRYVTEALKEHVRWWITINEPGVYAYKSFVEGAWPPGEHSLSRAWQVVKKLINMHIASYDVIHEIYQRFPELLPPMVGISKSLLLFAPCRPEARMDRCAAALQQFCFNRLITGAFARRKHLDFLGINYYGRVFTRFTGLHIHGACTAICDNGHHGSDCLPSYTNPMVYPQGLYDILLAYSRYQLPVVITENGMRTDDDDQRALFIREHLAHLARALQAGVRVLGYIHWSLMDNFEWSEGFSPHFGLVHVNYETQQRVIKKSAHIFADICRSHSVSLSLNDAQKR